MAVKSKTFNVKHVAPILVINSRDGRCFQFVTVSAQALMVRHFALFSAAAKAIGKPCGFYQAVEVIKCCNDQTRKSAWQWHAQILMSKCAHNQFVYLENEKRKNIAA